MTDITSAIQPWRKLLNKFQPYTEIRHGLIGDGNGAVQVAAFPGWSWIRYDDVQSKLSMVRNSAYAMLPDGVPVVVGKRYHTDEYEQVLRIDTAQYASDMDQDTINQYLLTPHGISHRGLGSDPAPIDLNNIVVGKVVPDDPASLSVEIYSFVYENGLVVSLYVGGLLDLTAHVPANANHHRYVLVYLEQATGTAGAVAGEIIPVPVGLPSVPDALPDTIPLAIVLLINGQTEILIGDIIQWKLIWGVVGGTVGPHTHTDDTSGGTSLIGIEELMVACWVDITIDGNAISPTDVYHRLLVSEGMYIVGDDVSVELITIHPDPVHGCGQLLFLRVVDSPMYASYNVILRHGVGNIQLNADTDVVMHAGDHVLLICDGTYWHDIGLGGLLGATPSPHPLNSVHHSGELADGQAPQFLKTDGTRDLVGNLAVDPAVTIDGIDISAHAADNAAHHALVTLAGGSAPELTLAGQELTLAAVVSEAEHTKAQHDALNIDADTVDGVHLPATLPEVLTPFGDSGIFSAADGKLLLGPGCELTATSWKSLRGQVGTIANAFQTRAGSFPGTQGIVMEPAGLNYCFNGAMRDNDASTLADRWSITETLVGAYTPSVVAHPNAIMGWVQRTQYTGVAGDVNKYIHYYYRTAAASFAPGENGVASCDIAGVATGVGVSLWLCAENAANGILGLVNQAVTLSGGLQRVFILYPNLPATTDHVAVYVQIDTVDNGDTFDVRFGAVNVEKRASPTTFCSGQLPWCSWSGAVYASTSVRAGTTMTIPTAGNISATRGSIILCFRSLVAPNASWGALFAAGNGNTEFDGFIEPTGKAHFSINGALRCESAILAVDQDHQVVFEWDSAEDDSWLFVDGVLVDSGTCGGGAWTPHTYLGIGYSPALNNAMYNLCGIVTEFAVLGDLLTAAEVAATYNLRRAMVDHGAIDSPVLALLDISPRHLTLRPDLDYNTITAQGKPTTLTVGTFKGYSFPIYAADNEEIFLTQTVTGRWDGTSDIVTHLLVALTGTEDVGDNFKFQLSWEYVTAGDVVPATTHDVVVEQAVLAGRTAQYASYQLDFTLDYDVDSADIVIDHDLLAMRIRRLDATNPDVSNEIMVLDYHLRYKVNKVFKE